MPAAATTTPTNICRWDDFVGGRPPIRGTAAATIGTFDGVHLGHRAILRRLGATGADARVVLTFRRHPRAVLTGTAPPALTSLRQRRERFADHAVTHVVLIDFSEQFSRLSGVEFIRMLRSRMSLRALVAGVDFRCGCGRDTDVAALRRLLTPANIGVFPVPPVTWGGEPVSSSRIRAAVHAGNFDATREMMGAPFEIDLCAAADALPPPTSRFHFAAEQVGYLVPNTDQILPRTGAYAASVITSGGESIDSVAEVSLAGVRYTLPPGNRHAPLSLRFHRRVAGNDDAL